MAHHENSMSHSMQPPPSPAIPIDPALSLYPPYYPYQQPQHPIHTQHLSLPPHYSSPSSQGSESLGTPPTDHMSFTSNGTGKRSSSSIVNNNASGSRKKPRNEDDDDMNSPSPEKEEGKAKPTRGSRCVVFRPIGIFVPTYLSLSQCLYSMPSSENEMCRSRTRSALQTVSGRKPPMYI